MGKEKPTLRPIQQDCIDMGSNLTLDQQVHLLKPFSLKEVRTAMFSILSTKSPAPDGFGSGFFKSVWPEMGKEIHRAIIHFFETNQFPADLHNTGSQRWFLKQSLLGWDSIVGLLILGAGTTGFGWAILA
uniref:Uncharacterized protein n=1 Tax=Cannabis sativa TaxID=3483 RepID=A0A803NKP1_CANSA